MRFPKGSGKVLDWKDWIPYPYKGYALTDPQYIKDKDETFAKNGNGWWWNDGKGWSMDYESPIEKYKRKKREELDDITRI